MTLGTEQGLAVALRGAAKRYSWGGQWVLRAVDLELGRGVAVELRGANGSGKSTLLRMLAGASLPSRGSRLANPGLRIGYAPEAIEPPPLAAGAFLRHHVRMRAGRDGDAAGLSNQVWSLAERLECADLLGEAMAALSKGSLRKVVLIQALLGGPDALVLDEPFDGLDTAAQEALATILGERAVAGAAVVFSDHRQAGPRPPLDGVWLVVDGSVRRLGPDEGGERGAPEELRERVEAAAVDIRLGELLAAGWHIERVEPGEDGRTAIVARRRSE